MDSPPRESDVSKKKKKEDGDDNSRSKSSLRRSFKWLLDRGSKKKKLAQQRSSSEDDEDSREVPTSRQETPEDPERSGLDLFDQSSSNSDRTDLPEVNDDNSSGYAINLGAHQSEDANDIREAKSTPGRKRLATRTLSLTSDSSDSSDSEVEFNHLCGTKGKGRRSLEKRKGKRKKEEIQHEGRGPTAGGIRDEKGKGKDKGKRLVKKSSLPRRQEFDPPQDDDYDKVVVQFAKSPPAARLAATSGLHTSTSRDINDAGDDGDSDADDDDDDEVPMDESGGGALVRDEDEEDDATIMVLKRGKKSGGRTGSTWPRQSDAPTTTPQSASGSGVAATHPRGRGNRPGVPSAEVRNLIKSPSQKSGIGSGGGGSGATGSGSSIGSGGDVEVRVRTTARGTSVSVLLPSGNASGGSGNNNASASVSGRSSSSRDVRTGGGTFLPPSQTTALQRRRRQSSSTRRNSLPAATHHSIHSPPLPPSVGFSASAGYSAPTASSFPDMTEETPMRGVAAAPLSSVVSLTSRRTSVIQIDDDDDGDDDGDEEEDDDDREDDEPVVEYERISSTVGNRSEDRDFPDVIEEDDALMGAAGPSQSRSPDAAGVINQIDDDARLARQLQEEFDREMASSMAREMERDARGRGAGSGSNVDGERMNESTSTYGEEGEFVPGAPGPYYDLAATRRRLSRALATASSHVGAVSRAPPARRRAGGVTVGSGALPLEFSLGFGFGSPLGGVVGGDITASDVEAILGDEDDSTNESSNDSDVLYEESQRPTARGAFDLELGNARSARLATTRRAEGRSSSSSRRGPQPLVSIRRGVRASSTPSVQNEERNEDGIEENDLEHEEPRDIDEEGEGDDGQPPHESATDLVSAPSIAAPSAQAPRRSRRLQRGPTSGLLSSVGGSGTRAAAAASSRSSAAAAWSSLVSSSPLSTSLNDVVGIPLQRVTSTTQLSSSSTSVDRGPPAPSGPRGLLRGRLARAAMTSSTPALNTLGLSVAPSAASRGPRPLSTSRSPTGRGPRGPTPRGRTRPASESLDAETNEDVSTSAAATAAGESSVSCAACEAIQSRIQTYLEEVRTLQDTPVEGYDANFERMRVTTQLMRQTNEAMREWRNHTSQAAHHSLEERSHRLNTMSAIYRQISEIIQGAVRGLSPGTPLSSTRSRSRASRSSRENANSTPAGSTSSSRTTRGQRYPGESSNAQFQFRRPRAPHTSYPTPRLFVGQLPPGRLMALANGWPATLDYETLLRLGDIMGDVVPQGLSQTQINRLPTHIYNAEKQKAATPSSASGGEREDHKQCHVCLTEYDEGEQLRILPCFHRFHSACIDEWIKTNPTCPLCRVRVEFDD